MEKKNQRYLSTKLVSRDMTIVLQSHVKKFSKTFSQDFPFKTEPVRKDCCLVDPATLLTGGHKS